MGNLNGMANAGVQKEAGISEEIIQGGLGSMTVSFLQATLLSKTSIKWS